MDPIQLALWAFAVLLGLIFMGVPIALAMMAVGLVGSYLIFVAIDPLL